MNLKKAFLLSCSAALLISLSIVSCKKNSDSTDTDTEAAQNNSDAESTYNDVSILVDLAVTNGTNMTYRQESEQTALGASCVTVTVDSVSTPHTVTIDFGSTNCLCGDGRYRRGKIIATYTGRYRDSGTVITTTFDNYFVSDNQIEGTHTVTNLGTNAAGHPVYKIEVNGEIVRSNNRGTITWTSTRQREWLAGYDTPGIVSDDTYSITGSASGTTVAGRTYTVNITKALVRSMSCYFFESGTVEITPQNGVTRTLDYGNGGCDAYATVTILGKTFNIVLL